MVRTASSAPPHGPDITAFLDLQAADQASLGELAHGLTQLLSAFNAKLDAEDSYEMFAHWSRAAEVSDWNTSLAGSSEPQHPQEPEDLLAPEEPHNAFPEVARRVEQSATLLTSVQTRLLSFAHQATRSPEDQRALLGVPTGSSMTYGNGRIFYLEALGLGKPISNGVKLEANIWSQLLRQAWVRHSQSNIPSSSKHSVPVASVLITPTGSLSFSKISSVTAASARLIRSVSQRSFMRSCPF